MNSNLEKALDPRLLHVANQILSSFLYYAAKLNFFKRKRTVKKLTLEIKTDYWVFLEQTERPLNMKRGFYTSYV